MLEPIVEDVKLLEQVYSIDKACYSIVCVCKNPAISSCAMLCFSTFSYEKGVEFVIDMEKMSFRGTVTVVSADNLSAQLIGGYKALNSAFRKCRYCMATDDTMQAKVNCMYTYVPVVVVCSNTRFVHVQCVHTWGVRYASFFFW